MIATKRFMDRRRKGAPIAPPMVADDPTIAKRAEDYSPGQGLRGVVSAAVLGTPDGRLRDTSLMTDQSLDEVGERIRLHVKDMYQCRNDAIRHLLRVGDLLLANKQRVHDQLGHGEWMGWVKRW